MKIITSILIITLLYSCSKDDNSDNNNPTPTPTPTPTDTTHYNHPSSFLGTWILDSFGTPAGYNHNGPFVPPLSDSTVFDTAFFKSYAIAGTNATIVSTGWDNWTSNADTVRICYTLIPNTGAGITYWYSLISNHLLLKHYGADTLEYYYSRP